MEDVDDTPLAAPRSKPCIMFSALKHKLEAMKVIPNSELSSLDGMKDDIPLVVAPIPKPHLIHAKSASKKMINLIILVPDNEPSSPAGNEEITDVYLDDLKDTNENVDANIHWTTPMVSSYHHNGFVLIQYTFKHLWELEWRTPIHLPAKNQIQSGFFNHTSPFGCFQLYQPY